MAPPRRSHFRPPAPARPKAQGKRKAAAKQQKVAKRQRGDLPYVPPEEPAALHKGKVNAKGELYPGFREIPVFAMHASSFAVASSVRRSHTILRAARVSRPSGRKRHDG